MVSAQRASSAEDMLAEGGRHVAIVGAGSIGLGFAIAFAQAGLTVRLQDPDTARFAQALETIRARLLALAEHGLLDEVPDAVAGRISFHETLADILPQAGYVQECAPENLALKQELYRQLDELTPRHVVIGGSTSAIPASQYAGDIAGRDRCLVCHPANPPYLLRIIEIVPASFSSEQSAQQARALFAASGFAPVVVRKEIEGFALNRLQGAVLREAYCLVRDGVLSVDEVDSLVRDGLGLRWSFMGPFETVDLNTRGGIASHAQKMGPAYARMGAERGQNDPWTDDLVETVSGQRRAISPLDEWEAMNAWRDARLMALLRHRREVAGIDAALRGKMPTEKEKAAE
ncbi:MAG: 3-hydroxyacyl-CoA dehydrogenase [Mesorhizobium sp.]